MSKITCSLIDKDDNYFSCGNEQIDSEIKASHYATLLKQAYGYKIIVDNNLVGYYMIHFRKISFELVQLDDYDAGLDTGYIAVHIKYIAIEKDKQHHKCGTFVLKGVIAELLNLSKKYPIRLITLDAVLQYHDWYLKHGFRDVPKVESDGYTQAMYMDCVSNEEKLILDQYVNSIA